MPLRGNAGFTFTPPGGVLTEHALAWPLRNPRPAGMKSRWESWSLDFTEREVLVVGTGAAEILAEIRFDTDAPGLLEMLEAGADGATLTYYPDLAVTGTYYTCELVEPAGNRIEVLRDQARSVKGEYEVTIRLRRTDGGTFDALL